MKSAQPVSLTIRQIEFELEKAQHGMSMPYDGEHVAQLLQPCRRSGRLASPPAIE